jgi:hypothetical protein
MRLDLQGRDVTDSPGLHDENDWIIPEWPGDPAYKTPSACNDERNTYRVFHRDQPGRVIAEFYGEKAEESAKMFCLLFGN